VINRFSEEVNFSIEKAFFGIDQSNWPETATSRKKKKVITEKFANACVQYVQVKLLTSLRENLGDELQGLNLTLDNSDPHAQS